MNPEALSNHVALGERFTTEFKCSGTAGLGREICAFANVTGETILLGVSDDGEVCGVGNHNHLKSEVQSIARSADPPIAVEIERARKVLCVRVPAQQSEPYSFGGKFFIREGASSQQTSREEIREFYFKDGLIRFDETHCRKFDLEHDLTAENWVRFARPVEHAKERGTRHVAPHVPDKYPVSILQVRNFIYSLDGVRTRSEILQNLGLKDRTNLAKEYVQPALAEGLIEMTIPDKPRGSKQKYRLTDNGSELQDHLRKTQ